MTLCDFRIREIGNPNKSHKYTVQCVLPINLFNQQIFTAIWFWYILVLVWNIVLGAVWIRRCLPKISKRWIIRRICLINESLRSRKGRLKHFLDIYLEPDGIFMIRMIANNTSDYVATDLIHHLWCQHAENYENLFPSDPHSVPDVKCRFKHKKIKQSEEKPYDNENFHEKNDSLVELYNRLPSISDALLLNRLKRQSMNPNSKVVVIDESDEGARLMRRETSFARKEPTDENSFNV